MILFHSCIKIHASRLLLAMDLFINSIVSFSFSYFHVSNTYFCPYHASYMPSENLSNFNIIQDLSGFSQADNSLVGLKLNLVGDNK